MVEPVAERPWWLGMRRVTAFNWPIYALALLVALGSVLALRSPIAPLRFAGATALITSLWFTCASLGATWWAYDGSRLFRWAWLRPLIPAPRRWLSLHAGVDESTPSLLALFAGEGHVVDLFRSGTMTAASLLRARATFQPELPAATFDGTRLPHADADIDAVFAIFALHELRSEDGRVAVMEEIRRVLADTGRVVVVEHLRDVANALAYGPGAWHFLARRTWLRTFASAGLAVEHEVRINVLVRAFVLRKARGAREA